MNATTITIRSTLAVAACVAALGYAEQCSAQVARYEPSTPTVSPYLNLTLFNNGGLPNYFALVRPQIRQRNFNLQQQALLRQQSKQITRLQTEVIRGQEAESITGTGSWFLIPSQRTNYLDTRSYFPEPGGGGRR